MATQFDYNPSAERWLRRGHKREPNGIVRGIYWLSDWFGDFGPMLNAIKQSVISTGLILVNLIILIGVLISSAAHSLQLLRHAGASHGIEYVLLVVFELLFLFSSLLLDQAFKLGIASLKKSWHVWLPFGIGLLFVLCSNIVGMSPDSYISVFIREYSGLVIGAIMPLLLLSSKWMLYWQVNIRAEYERKRRFEKVAENSAESEKNLTENSSENEVEKISDESEMSPATMRDTSSKNLQKNDSKLLQKSEESASENAAEITAENSTESAEKSAQKSEKKAVKKTVKSAKKSARRKRGKSRKDREKILEKATAIIKKALEETGEYPTHETVAALAHTTRYYAQEARKMVEAELEKQKETQQQQEKADENKQLILEKKAS